VGINHHFENKLLSLNLEIGAGVQQSYYWRRCAAILLLAQVCSNLIIGADVQQSYYSALKILINVFVVLELGF
jgi:hypothetical protein